MLMHIDLNREQTKRLNAFCKALAHLSKKHGVSAGYCINVEVGKIKSISYKHTKGCEIGATVEWEGDLP